MSSSSEDNTERFDRLMKTIDSLVEHYSGHLQKVIIGNYPDCMFCQKLIQKGMVIQDEGKLVRGLSRTAQAFGDEAYVLVPKSWVGKRVRISLVEDNQVNAK